MASEERSELLESLETDHTIKNRILKGLQIFAKYTDDVMVEPAHDEIFAGCKNEENDKITKEDLLELGKLGWMADDESEGFSIFT